MFVRPVLFTFLSAIFPFHCTLLLSLLFSHSTPLFPRPSSFLLMLLLFSLLFSALLLFDLDFSDLRSMEICFRNISIKCPNRQTFFKQKYNKDTPLDIFYKSWGNFRQWSQIKTGFIRWPNPSDSRNLNDLINPLVLWTPAEPLV